MTQDIQIDEKHEADLVREIGLFAIKTVVTLCSGGFIVVLTFLASFNENSLWVADIERIKCALLALLCGLVFCVITLFVSYLISQRRLANSIATKFDRSLSFIVVQSGPLIIAFTCFVAGVLLAITGISAK